MAIATDASMWTKIEIVRGNMTLFSLLCSTLKYICDLSTTTKSDRVLKELCYDRTYAMLQESLKVPYSG